MSYLGVERSKQVCRYGTKPPYWFAWMTNPLLRFDGWMAKATLWLSGIGKTGTRLETEEDVIESRADLRHHYGKPRDECEASADIPHMNPAADDHPGSRPPPGGVVTGPWI